MWPTCLAIHFNALLRELVTQAIPLYGGSDSYQGKHMVSYSDRVIRLELSDISIHILSYIICLQEYNQSNQYWFWTFVPRGGETHIIHHLMYTICIISYLGILPQGIQKIVAIYPSHSFSSPITRRANDYINIDSICSPPANNVVISRNRPFICLIFVSRVGIRTVLISLMYLDQLTFVMGMLFRLYNKPFPCLIW